MGLRAGKKHGGHSLRLESPLRMALPCWGRRVGQGRGSGDCKVHLSSIGGDGVGPLLAAYRDGLARSAAGSVSEDGLRALHARAAAAWPALALPPPRFAALLGRTVARELDHGDEEREVLARLAIEDLAVAWACAEGLPGAAALFEKEWLARLPEQLRARRLAPFLVDELLQVVRTRMLLAGRDGRPGIAAYSGRTSLRGWLRVVAARVAIDLQRRRGAVLPAVEAGGPPAGQPPGSGDSPESGLVLRRHRPDLEAAFAEAVAALPSEQRELLYLHYVEGLTIDDIGARQEVHRATAARWIAAGREAIVEGTRRRLEARLALSPSECASLLRALLGDFQMSVSSVLRQHRAEGGALPRRDPRGRRA